MTIASGTIGTCNWNISDDGVLTIGAGTINVNYSAADQVPWYSNRVDIYSISTTSSTIFSGGILSYLFFECEHLENISTLSNWNISNITGIRSIFSGCTALQDISALSNWNVSNVTDMRNVFDDCSSLQSISALSNWNVSNVTNMYMMFASCDNLTDIFALTNWDTSRVISMYMMFSYCENLANISALANWDTSNVTNTSYMFQHCHKLTDISALANWNTSSVTNASYMFRGCYSLSGLFITNAAPTTITNMFADTINQICIIDKGSSSPSTLQTIANAYNNVTYVKPQNFELAKLSNKYGLAIGTSTLKTNIIPIYMNTNVKEDIQATNYNINIKDISISDLPDNNYIIYPFKTIDYNNNICSAIKTYKINDGSGNIDFIGTGLETQRTINNQRKYNSINMLIGENKEVRYEVSDPQNFRRAIDISDYYDFGDFKEISLGTYYAPGVLTNGGSQVVFTIPTARRMTTTAANAYEITMNMAIRCGNSNGTGYYIAKKTSGGTDSFAFSTKTGGTFYNANNVQRTINSSTATTNVNIYGNSNIYININAYSLFGNDFFSGTSTIRGYTNNHPCLVSCFSVKIKKYA